jgi:hypothetical protein
MVGVCPGAVIVNVTAFDALPEVNTVTLAVPWEAIRLLGMEANKALELWNPVVTVVPFHSTIELLWNPEPFTVMVNDPPPAAVELGVRLVIVGAGVLDAVTVTPTSK